MSMGDPSRMSCTMVCHDPDCTIYGCRVFWPNGMKPTLTKDQYLQMTGISQPRGCICPPTSEQTCMSKYCPRK
jgi:hypothetical protein